MSLTRLEDGLRLPNRGILVPWGGRYESLEATATKADSWLPHGGSVRYGQLHWEDELLLPLPSTPTAKGKVIAYVRGEPLTVRRFELYLWDYGILKRECARYAAWMHGLTKLLGAPQIDAAGLSNECFMTPTLRWSRGKVTIECFYELFKGDECSGVRITHSKFDL